MSLDPSIKLLILDVDGVLTDGTVACTAEGEEQKTFSFRDVDAVFEAHQRGMLVGIVTGEDGPWVDFLIQRLSVELVRRGAKDKLAAVRELASSAGIDLAAVCYVGDADRDAPALAAVGLGLSPADASAEAKRAASSVLSSPGGRGAVAEAVRLAVQFKQRAIDSRVAIGCEEAPRGDWLRRVREIIDESVTVHQAVAATLGPVIVEAAGLITKALAEGGKVIIFGNGGSASDAEHMAAEMVGRFACERKGLPAIALSANSSVITALGNDFGQEEIFARQVEALGKPGDVAVAISTSGRSRNVIAAANRGSAFGLTVLALTGADPGEVGAAANLSIAVPSSCTARVQEAHRVIIHALCELVEGALPSDQSRSTETGGRRA